MKHREQSTIWAPLFSYVFFVHFYCFLLVVLVAGRSGLVNDDLSIYSSLSTDFGIKPTVEICACVVDLLGRSGDLDRALNFVKTMPVEPGPAVWGSLVTASVLRGNHDMQDLAYRFLIQLEPKNPSNYISLSNFYASSRRWDVVAEMRRMMKERGLKKAPGSSCISINSKTHCFYVADNAHIIRSIRCLTTLS